MSIIENVSTVRDDLTLEARKKRAPKENSCDEHPVSHFCSAQLLFYGALKEMRSVPKNQSFRTRLHVNYAAL